MANDTITFALLGLLVFGLALLGYALFSLTQPVPVEIISANFQAATAGGIPDKCKVPSGYTTESWVEHLGHHPDRYADCFQYFQ